MLKKESALLSVAADQQGYGIEDNLNLTRFSAKVKSKSQKDFEYWQNTFTRFKLLYFAQRLLFDHLVIKKNSNFSKCHRSTLGGIVSLKRNPKTDRAYYNGVVTCANSKCCPVCASRIMGLRSAEIKTAVHGWLNESPENTCYMLTLTFSHCAKDSLSFLLSRFRDALKSFWEHWTVKHIFSSSGIVGRITSTEIQYSRKNGFHPHQHILLFCRKSSFPLEKLRKCWFSALVSVGLTGLADIALDLIEARSVSDYLTKISSEMALGNLKQGRGVGHYSPMQILFEAANGADWAGDIFSKYFQAVRGAHFLQWSRGLKDHFGISSVSDEEISSGAAEPKLVQFLDLFSEGFVKLSCSDKALLQNYASKNDWPSAVEFLDRCGVECFKQYKPEE